MSIVAWLLFVAGVLIAPIVFIVHSLKTSTRPFRYSMRALITFVIGCSLLLMCCVKGCTSQHEVLLGLLAFSLVMVWIIAGIVAISWSATTKEGCEITGSDVIAGSFVGVYAGFILVFILGIFCLVLSRI